MSFSKAKLHRFNDIQPCAPSPAAYNITIKDKVKSTVLPLSERFIEAKSPAVSETGSTQSTPCVFRTPTLLKRKKTTTSAKKSKPKELFAENTDLEALKDKIVECENKDAFIRDLSGQIEELKENMGTLERQKKQLDLDKRKFEESLVNLKVEHGNLVKELTDKYEEDICRATEEKIKIKDEIILLKKEYEQLKDANRKEMQELKINCDKFNVLYNKSVEECNRLVAEKDTLLKIKEQELRALDEKYIDIQTTHALEIEELKKEHQLEIQNIEFEMLKTMTELQKERENTASKITEIQQIMDKEIRTLRKGFEDEKQEILRHSEAKLKQVEDNIQESVELQLEEKLEKVKDMWSNRLANQEKESNAILKECQAISEYNIIQCELEKNQTKMHLMEKTKELEDVQLKYQEVVQNYEELNTKFKALQCELNNMITELNETRRILAEEFNIKKKEIRKIADEKRAYEVTIKHSQLTIEVLTRRLINSDKDVEQLKKELSDIEDKMLEYESKCMQLTSDLKQAQTYNEELEMQYESTIKLNTNEIQQLKYELVNKVEAFKMKYSEKYIEQSVKYDELLQKYKQVDEENLENKNKLKKLSKELDQREHSREWYNKQQEVYDNLLGKYEELEKENSSNKKIIEEQQSLRERLEKTEVERDVLLGRVEYLENELKEVSSKYTDLVGHQNNKQKIKHLVDLKTKNEELIQTNMDLELKLRSKLKGMEKLKKENSDLKKCLRKSKLHPEDKENISSPNRSLNTSRIESPFRDRN